MWSSRHACSGSSCLRPCARRQKKNAHGGRARASIEAALRFLQSEAYEHTPEQQHQQQPGPHRRDRTVADRAQNAHAHHLAPLVSLTPASPCDRSSCTFQACDKMVAVIHAAERGQHIIDSLPTQQGRRTIPSTRPDGGCEVLLRFSHEQMRSSTCRP